MSVLSCCLSSKSTSGSRLSNHSQQEPLNRTLRSGIKFAGRRHTTLSSAVTELQSCNRLLQLLLQKRLLKAGASSVCITCHGGRISLRSPSHRRIVRLLRTPPLAPLPCAASPAQCLHPAERWRLLTWPCRSSRRRSYNATPIRVSHSVGSLLVEGFNCIVIV